MGPLVSCVAHDLIKRKIKTRLILTLSLVNGSGAPNPIYSFSLLLNLRLLNDFLSWSRSACLLNNVTMRDNTSTWLLPAGKIIVDSNDGTLHSMTALDDWVQTHSESGAEHPENANCGNC